ncbi:polysaccharide biosynthesis protein [Candidatus Sumerlaeota bacterium]|nr:polysaccharide biosynthesis protein [Candidatus Sumerlaeota bacterium]
MLKSKIHRVILLLLDALLIAVALGMAYLIRRDFRIEPEYRLQYLHILPFVLFIRILLFFFFNLYKGMLRYASVSELVAIVASSIIGSVIFVFCNLILENFPRLGGLPIHPSGESVLRIPWGVVAMEGILSMLLIGGERFSRRILLTLSRRTPKNARRAIIIGAGDQGEAVAREMKKYPSRGFRPICFADDNPALRGKHIHGLPVIGSLDEIPEAIARYRIDDVIVAITHLPPKKLSQIIQDCKDAPVTFRIAPSMQDVIEGIVEVGKIRKVDIEDLLGREPVKLTLPEERNYIRGETVLVTGAGGSIGSELCRQLATYNPSRLLLLGKGENSIYEIASEFRYNFKDSEMVPIIADVTDEQRLRGIFSEYKPTICFHAAAHKHVPLMEMYPQEAIKNNVWGTMTLARLADEFKLKIFLLISTDKAVNPTSVMGATKRLAELIVFSLGEKSKTRFLAVRFGNVLGSRGSVVPLFKKQIERGGPVTLTDPNVMRYFMTIPEAVSLVLFTGSMRDKGRLFLLDMGEPVKIADLAKNLITLSGFDPEKDIDIVYTGLRPGEKLCEDLLTELEGVQKSEQGKIFFTRGETLDWQKLQSHIERLKSLADHSDKQGILKSLKELIKDYHTE